MGWGVLSKALFRIEIYEYMLDVGIWLVKQSKRKEKRDRGRTLSCENAYNCSLAHECSLDVVNMCTIS